MYRAAGLADLVGAGPKPVVATPVQQSPMSPVIVVEPVLVIVEPPSSANESAVPSGTGEAADAVAASAGVIASARARAWPAAILVLRGLGDDMEHLRPAEQSLRRRPPRASWTAHGVVGSPSNSGGVRGFADPPRDGGALFGDATWVQSPIDRERRRPATRYRVPRRRGPAARCARASLRPAQHRRRPRREWTAGNALIARPVDPAGHGAPSKEDSHRCRPRTAACAEAPRSPPARSRSPSPHRPPRRPRSPRRRPPTARPPTAAILTFSLESPLDASSRKITGLAAGDTHRRHRRAAGQRRALRRHEGLRRRRSRLHDRPRHRPGDARVRPRRARSHAATGAATPIVLSGSEFGVDFNPAADALRIVSNTGQNLRALPSDRVAAMTSSASPATRSPTAP